MAGNDGSPEFIAGGLEVREHDSVHDRQAAASSEPGEHRQLLEGLPEVFAGGAGRIAREGARRRSPGPARVDRGTVERDVFQALSRAERVRMIERGGAESFKVGRSERQGMIEAVPPSSHHGPHGLR